MLQELQDDVPGLVAGDGEADALNDITSTDVIARHQGVDPNDLARKIEQRSSTVAVVDGSVGLEHVVHLAIGKLAMQRGLDGCTLRVDSRRGVVILAGKVTSELQKDVAVNTVRNINGVRAVKADFSD